MSAPLAPAVRSFIDYFGELGPRWGLGADACRAHAYLYLAAAPATLSEVAEALQSDEATATAALAELVAWRMAASDVEGRWSAGSDPWEMLFAGLEERRRREVGPALAAMRGAHAEAMRDPATGRTAARRIGEVLALVEDLAALDTQARRVSPRAMRQLIGLGGRAARFLNRAGPAGAKPET